MKHTKGLLYLDESNEYIYVVKSENSLHVASTMHKDEERKENAKRIVKCWNMHDELVNVLKKAIDISDLWTFDNNTAVEHEDEAKALHAMKLEFDRLIKKATE